MSEEILTPTNSDDPSEPKPLSAKEKRIAALNTARLAKKLKRERQDAADAKKSEDAPQAPPVDLRMVENAYAGLWLVMKLTVWWLARATHVLDDLSTTEITTDSKLLLPLVERHPTLSRILSWIGAPIVLVRRVHEKLRRKPIEPAPELAADISADRHAAEG